VLPYLYWKICLTRQRKPFGHCTGTMFGMDVVIRWLKLDRRTPGLLSQRTWKKKKKKSKDLVRQAVLRWETGQ
jgi:hypothetical protein